MTLAAGASLLCLLCCELVVRLFLPQTLYTFERGMFLSDESVGYRLSPNYTGRHAQPEYRYTIRTNSWGWRGPEPRLHAVHRVLVVGDSIAFGQGVDEGKHLCARVTEHFAGRGIDLDLLNASAPGYCLRNEVGVVRETLPRYQPTLTIQMLCANDFGTGQSLRVVDGYLVKGAKRPAMVELRTWLNRHCYLYCLVKEAYYASTRRRDRTYQARLEPYRKSDLDYVVKTLLEMDSLCKAAGSKFLVFITPDPVALGAPMGWLRDMLALLRQSGVRCANPAEELTREDFNGRIFPHDNHWNEPGSTFIGAMVTKAIEAELDLAADTTAPRRDNP